MVYDYQAHWMTRIQPQGRDFRFHELAFRWYEAVRRLGMDVDFVAPGTDVSGYKLDSGPNDAACERPGGASPGKS